MAGVSKAEVEQARRVDLLAYLQKNDPTELVKRSGSHYSTRTHDSVDISNGKWYRWSTGQCGSDALSYLTYVCGMNFVEAVRRINGQEYEKAPAFSSDRAKPQVERRLLLPKKNKDNRAVEKYLMSRGIDPEIISSCIESDIVFEDADHHNAIFVGTDTEGVPRYAAYRSTGDKRVLGDVAGSDKHYSFRLMGGLTDNVHLFESAIDALSYITLLKMDGYENWRDGNYISMAGVFAPVRNMIPVSLESVVKDENIGKVYIHFDNDRPGREATNALAAALADMGRFEVIDAKPPYGKDFNDYLKDQLSRRAQLVCEERGDYVR